MFRNIFWLADFRTPWSVRCGILPPPPCRRYLRVQRLADAQWLVRTRWATRFCPAPVKITGEYRALLCKRARVARRTRRQSQLRKGRSCAKRDRPFHPRCARGSRARSLRPRRGRTIHPLAERRCREFWFKLGKLESNLVE